MSLYGGMFSPPVLTRVTTVSSFTGFPLLSLAWPNNPLRPGPTFLSTLVALWQGAHCSKTVLPLAASPLFDFSGLASANTTAASATTHAHTAIILTSFIHTSLQFPRRAARRYNQINMATPTVAPIQEGSLAPDISLQTVSYTHPTLP